MDDARKIIKWDWNVAIAIDFDGTIYKNNQIDKTALKYIKRFKQYGCKLVLWSCRMGEELNQAINICKEVGIIFDYINEYPPRESYPKINTDFYIDDRSYPINWRYYNRKIKRLIKRRKNYEKD